MLSPDFESGYTIVLVALTAARNDDGLIAGRPDFP
jgi:hypothetical protein